MVLRALLKMCAGQDAVRVLRRLPVMALLSLVMLGVALTATASGGAHWETWGAAAVLAVIPCEK